MLKQYRVLFWSTLILIFLCLAQGVSASPENVGEVVYLRGVVKAQQPDKQKRSLEPGSPVFVHDQIFTYSDSNVEIKFKDETSFSQGEDANSALDDFVFSQAQDLPNLMFKLNKGVFRMVTGKIVKQNPDGFKRSTPLATIGIRGTQPFAEITSRQEVIGVLDIAANHTMEVTSVGGKVVMDKPNLVSTVSPSGQITPPAPLPAAMRQKVFNTVPMTSLGKLGAIGLNLKQRLSKIRAFNRQLAHIKQALPGISQPPDIGLLHQISVFSNALPAYKRAQQLLR